MGRRTAWWRVAAVGIVLGAVTGAPGSPGFASSASPSTPPASQSTLTSPSTSASPPSSASSSSATASSYAFVEDAPSVTGAADTADAERLEPGTTYRSSLPSDGKVYYGLQLDGTSTVYVAATAVPPTDVAVTPTEGVRVSLQDADGRSCSAADTASIGAGRSPRPLTVWGARQLSPSRSLCQGAGTYYVVVERVLRTESLPGDWDLELAPVLEPRLLKSGSTSAPESWDSATPSRPAGAAVRVRGGGGFGSATALEQGVWRDDVKPGQTLFYEVPVDWGQQVYATADLSSSSGGGAGGGFVPGGVNLALYNPVRGLVDATSISYNGSQKSGALAALPPVGYDNRYAVSDRVNGMRFAGAYYLVVHLAARVGEEFGDGPVGLMLRVRVKGEATAGPGYAGQSKPSGIFQVGLLGRASGAAGEADSSDGDGGGGGGDAGMKLVAVGGIGAGTVVLVVLGVWVVVGRRRAAGV
ncbi:hypothetical protein M2158_004364 [Streptomyces sp. SAI-144]|uniref:hypothetical protein n=1 Tax=Streptomyces sp. SAI-144 TaxID=2940544 RepID=UPI00247566F9|nr:hypothetical protein [Streptomyces sp. SAI-144]MDH6435887.1 hypothetical protein [Streptomyces sp. SAI-144]